MGPHGDAALRELRLGRKQIHRALDENQDLQGGPAFWCREIDIRRSNDHIADACEKGRAQDAVDRRANWAAAGDRLDLHQVVHGVPARDSESGHLPVDDAEGLPAVETVPWCEVPM